MSDQDVSADDLATQVTAIGALVRRERNNRRLSVNTLSQRAGVSFGLISELERGRGNPSLSTLQRLSRALDIPVAVLVSEPSDDEMIVRRDERYVLPSYGDDETTRSVRRELLTPRTQANLQVIRSTLPPGFDNEGSPFLHMGTEVVTVEQGRLIVRYGGSEMALDPGDTASYRCSTSHSWANGATGATVVLGVFSPFE